MTKKTLLSFIALLTLPLLLAWSNFGLYSIPHYDEKSSHLSYSNPNAPKGGRIRVGFEGSFNTLNPYAMKGHKAHLLSLVFQTLGQKTLDEADTFYPQLAEDFTLAPDRMSMRLKLYKDAKFSDGHPLTSEDLLFSFSILQSPEANPFYKSYWSDIKSLRILSAHEVEVDFHRSSPELPSLVMDIPVLPKHVYKQGSFSKDFASRALGSGPYTIEKYKFGSTVHFKRNEKFWARDHVFNRGRFNFDEIVLEYYRDQTSLLEAFKSGSLDFFIAYTIKSWRKDLVGDRFDRHWIVKEEWKHEMNQGALAYFFNFRKALFQDLRVRKAIALAFDFAWTNRVLFDNLYLESQSIYENSIYKAQGMPDQKEQALLSALRKEFPDAVPDEVFTKPMGSLGRGLSIKERLQEAHWLLKEAGYKMQKGVLKGPGGMLSFRLLLKSSSDLRMAEPFRKNLAKLGIQVDIEVKDRSTYMQKLLNHDFDLVSLWVPSSSAPGQEQEELWHSNSSKKAYSRNYYGLANLAVDKLLEGLSQSSSKEEWIRTLHCLDRLIYHLHLGVQNWYADKHRVAFWNRYDHPLQVPLYFFELEMLEFMWWDAVKEKRLQEAMQKRERVQ